MELKNRVCYVLFKGMVSLGGDQGKGMSYAMLKKEMESLDEAQRNAVVMFVRYDPPAHRIAQNRAKTPRGASAHGCSTPPYGLTASGNVANVQLLPSPITNTNWELATLELATLSQFHISQPP